MISLYREQKLNHLLAIGLPAALALLAGLAIGGLPLTTVTIGGGLIALVVAAAIEPAGALILLVIAAPMKALIETEAHLDLPADIGQILLLLALIVWAISRIVLRRPLRIPWSRLHWPILIFLVSVLPSLLGAWSPSHTVAELIKWIEALLLISLCLALFNRATVPWLVFALVLAGGVQAITGLYQFFGGSGAEHLLILDDRFFRAFGSFGQPNPFGGFMGFTFPLAAFSAYGYLIQLWRVWRRKADDSLPAQRPAFLFASSVFYGLMSVLLAAGMAASWSRGAWLGFGASLVAMLFFLPRSPMVGGLLVAGVLVLGGIIWQSGRIPGAIRERLASVVEELAIVEDARGAELTADNYAVVERVAHWQAATQMAEEHPWIGVGFGNYEVAYPSYRLIDWPMALGHAHNYYLNLLAETGIVGLLGYLIAWIWIFAISIGIWRRSQGLVRAWSIALLGIWVFIAVHSVVDKLYVNNLFMHLGVLLGVTAILHQALPPNTSVSQKGGL